MAASLLRAVAGDHLLALSAGIVPGGLDPSAIEVMKEVGIDIRGQESIEVAQALKIHFGYVITLYDATKERSPILPFTFNLLQWSVLDPVTVNGLHARRIEAFRNVREAIHSRIQGFLGETAEKKQEQGVLVSV